MSEIAKKVQIFSNDFDLIFSNDKISLVSNSAIYHF